MNNSEQDVEANLVELDEMPIAQVLLLDGSDAVLADSLRRIIDAAGRRSQDTVAAFNNYI